jgi:hypothetical protein
MPFAHGTINEAAKAFYQPYQAYNGPRVADFSNDQLTGFDMVRQQAAAGNPLMGQANDYIAKQLSGGSAYTPGTNQYAGANPYLGQMIDSAQGDVTRAYNNVTAPGISSAFSSGGAYGGSAHAQAVAESQRQLANELGDVSTTLRNQDYTRQAALAESALDRQGNAWAMNRNQELAALGAIPGLNEARYDDARALMNIGQQQQNLWQSVYDQGHQDFTEGRDWQANRLGLLTNALSAIQGGQTSQTGPNPNYTSAGQNTAAMATALAALWG